VELLTEVVLGVFHSLLEVFGGNNFDGHGDVPFLVPGECCDVLSCNTLDTRCGFSHWMRDKLLQCTSTLIGWAINALVH
jgi:hypothetical protein